MKKEYPSKRCNPTLDSIYNYLQLKQLPLFLPYSEPLYCKNNSCRKKYILKKSEGGYNAKIINEMLMKHIRCIMELDNTKIII